jgi:hypothetical protein
MPITLSSTSAQRIRRVEGRQRAAFDPSLTFRQPRPNDRGWPTADWRLSAADMSKRTFAAQRRGSSRPIVLKNPTGGRLEWFAGGGWRES